MTVLFSPKAQIETGQIRTRSSSRTLSTRNTKYSTNMVRPNIRLIFHRQAAMEMMTKRSIRKSSTMAQNRPLELTVTGSPLWNRVYINHGIGRLEPSKRSRNQPLPNTPVCPVCLNYCYDVLRYSSGINLRSCTFFMFLRCFTAKICFANIFFTCFATKCLCL